VPAKERATSSETFGRKAVWRAEDNLDFVSDQTQELKTLRATDD